MKIRIATKAWGGSSGRAAHTRDEAEFGVQIPWVEIDGHRTTDVISATVEVGASGDESTTIVTLKIVAAAEMVLVNDDGEILEIRDAP